MFDKYSDQAGDRRLSFWGGLLMILASALCFYEEFSFAGFAFALMGIASILPAILCDYESFETVRRIWLWIIAFG